MSLSAIVIGVWVRMVVNPRQRLAFIQCRPWSKEQGNRAGPLGSTRVSLSR